MDPLLYFPVFIYTVAALCVVAAVIYIARMDGAQQLSSEIDYSLSFLVCLIFALFIGFRPFDGLFGDTISYARIYDNFNYLTVDTDWQYEWIWQYLMLLCKRAGLSSSGFFTVVSLGYFFTAYFAICILTPKDVMVTLLFMLSSLMFYTFSINGLRNGLACHLVLLGIALLLKGRLPWAALVYICAFGIHRSTILPIVASIVGALCVRNMRLLILLWIVCIPVSLVSGSFFPALFASIGFDNRMLLYSFPQDMTLFRHSGFRWDFLLYSTLPVMVAWWVTTVKRVTDRWYTVIMTVYLLCNAFWILVIRSAYSNRFAYLSWFIYPIAIAYPFVNLPLWPYRHQKAALILIVYAAFNIILSHILGIK